MLPNVTKLPKQREPRWPRMCLDSWRDTFRRWEDGGEPVTLSLGTLNAIRHTLECNCLYLDELEAQLQPQGTPMTGQSIFVKLALQALRDALNEVVTVENVDNIHDALITRAQEAGKSFLGNRPVVAEAFDAICEKAKEGTAVATVIVGAINGMLTFRVGDPKPDLPSDLDPVASNLGTMQLALAGCDDEDCKCD